MDNHFNPNGGLTLVAPPGMEAVAQRLKALIEGKRGSTEPEHTPVDIAVPNINGRINKEPGVQLPDQHINGHDCVVLATGPGIAQMIVNLLLALWYVAGRHPRRVSIFFGYYPWARTDKDEGTLEFALPRLLADLMLTASHGRIHRIVCADPHSDQIVMSMVSGQITPVTMARRLIAKALEAARLEHAGRRICLVYPDDGANKRFGKHVGAVFTSLGLEMPVFNAWKRRLDDKTSRFGGLAPNAPEDLALLKGALVLSLDDELATGGTNLNLATELRTTYGVHAVWALASHGIFCGDAVSALERPDSPIARVFCTDTISFENRPELASLRESGRLQIVSWEHDLSNMIHRLHWDLTIRGIQ